MAPAAQSKKIKETEAERFKSRKQALDWLKQNGHKVSTGKFYQDCAAGYPMVAADGSVSKYQVLSYANDLGTQARPDLSVIESREFDQRKARADAEMAEMKAEKMRRESDKLWLHADDAWSVIAGLVGGLRDGIRHQLYTSRRELVHTAGGDQDLSMEFFEAVDAVIDSAFNETAKKSMNIQFEREVE